MKQMKRKGVAMIVIATSPAIALIGIVMVTIAIAYDIGDLLKGPIPKFKEGIAALGLQAEDTGRVIGQAIEPLREIEIKMSASLEKIEKLPEQIEIPAIRIPPLNLRIQPKVRVAYRKPASAYRYARYLSSPGEHHPVIQDGQAAFRRAVWVTDNQSYSLTKVRFGPKLPKPPANIPKPPVNVPRPPVNIPSLPRVQVEWENRQIQLSALPARTVPFPGLAQTKILLNQNVRLLGGIKDLASTLPILDFIISQAKSLLINNPDFLEAITVTGWKLLLLVILVIMLVVPLFISVYLASYLQWIASQWRNGWTLLLSKTNHEPDSTLFSIQEVKQ